jgi:predicted RecB family nuclease
MQIGTYALGVKRARGDDVKSDYYLNIVWYNKNDSKIRIQPVDPVWIDRAEQYWQDLNDFVDETGEEILNIKPDTAVGVPMMNWECNYCQFSKICKGE